MLWWKEQKETIEVTWITEGLSGAFQLSLNGWEKSNPGKSIPGQGEGEHNHHGIENTKGQDVPGPGKGRCGKGAVNERIVARDGAVSEASQAIGRVPSRLCAQNWGLLWDVALLVLQSGKSWARHYELVTLAMVRGCTYAVLNRQSLKGFKYRNLYVVVFFN